MRNNKNEEVKSTKSLGASSTTSAGWSAPMLAKHDPLQAKCFCMLHKITENNIAGCNKNKDTSN